MGHSSIIGEVRRLFLWSEPLYLMNGFQCVDSETEVLNTKKVVCSTENVLYLLKEVRRVEKLLVIRT